MGQHHPQEEREDEHPQHVAGDQTENDSGDDVDRGADHDGIAMLPAQDRVLPEVGNVRGVVMLGSLDHHPPHVRVEEAFLGIVGVVVGVDVAVVESVGGSPRDDAVFEGCGAEYREERPHRRRRRVCPVGEEPVVSGRDTEPGQQPHKNAGRDLDPGDAVGQDVPGDYDGSRKRG